MALTTEQIKELINKFINSKAYRSLNDMQKRITFLDIFKKTRKETYHSDIIAWIIENEEFNTLSETPVHLILKLAKASYNGSNDCIKNNLNSLCKKQITLSEVKADREVTTSSDDEDGRADIVITANLNMQVCSKDKIRIIIENKIDSKEGENQCKKYADHFDNENNEDNKGFLNVYIFLAPYKPDKLSSEKFISITYQELLDSVLYPIAKYKTEHGGSSLYLREYINTITSLKTNNILAMDNESSEHLKKLYEENKWVFYAFLDIALSDNPIYSSERIKAALNLEYKINYPDGTSESVKGHTKLAVAIAKFIARQKNQQDLLKEYGELKFDGTQEKYYLMDVDNTKGRYAKVDSIVCKDQKEVLCSNQWGKAKVKALLDLVRTCGLTVE